MATKDIVEYPYEVQGEEHANLCSPQNKRMVKFTIGRARLAAEKFADAIETIPLALAKNAGMDPLDTQGTVKGKSYYCKTKISC